MKKLVLITGLFFFAIVVFGQDAKLVKTYGGIPTSNANMKWQNNSTPNEKYIGVIHVDSTISASEIIEAFMATFRPLQDANLMTKQMHNNKVLGGVLSAATNDDQSLHYFSNAGGAKEKRQEQYLRTWTVQFIDGVRMSRFYYNVTVQAKQGRYKLIVIPAGLSGYAQNHIQYEWARMFRKGQLKSMYSKYYEQMKIKLAYTIDQWIKNVDKQLKEGVQGDW